MSEVESPTPSPVRIFVCSSPHDESYLAADSLLGFLRGLEQESVQFWQADVGAWNDETRAGIAGSDVALVLVSQGFLDSDWCARSEVAEYLRERRDAGMIVFPIILSSCEWERHEWIAARQFLPSGNETLEEHYRDDGQRKRLYLRIRKELRAAVYRAIERREAKEAAPEPEAVPAAARKQVTALHCSLSLTEKDGLPLDVEEAYEVMREIVPDFRALCGQVFQERGAMISSDVSGSAMLAWFGHPVAHEDDSRMAVRAGLAIVEIIATLSERFERELDVKLFVRVGIHTGVVITSGDDSPHGEAATIAARMHETAPAGGVVVSESTFGLVKPFFETEEGLLVTVPAAAQPLKSHRVIRATGAESRFDAAALQGLLPIVGRSQEVNFILDRWTAAKRENGQVMMLASEPGLGKSRLLHEVREVLREESHHWIESRCSPYHQNTPFHSIVGSWNAWLRFAEDDGDEARLAKLEQALQDFRDIPIEDLLPPLATLLSIPLRPPYQPLTALQPAEQKRRILEAVTATLLARTAEKPVVYVVEDLQWIDASTLELLEMVVENAATARILILFAFRPDFTPPATWLTGANISQITLPRLDRGEMEQMIVQITGGKPLPPELVEEIVSKTEGFPLFIEDLTRMVIETDVVEERDGEYVLAGPLRSLTIPSTLQETLLVRLERLASARVVAQVGATIGREFVFDLLRAVAGLDDKRLTEELGRLVSAGLLYKRGLLSRARYVFKHALVQEALRQSLLKRERKRYHRLIADVMEESFPDVVAMQPELIAYHFNEAGDAIHAIDYWTRAAEMNVRQSANKEALASVNSALAALEELPPGPERDASELKLRLIEGTVLALLHGWATSVVSASLDRARELCGTEGVQAMIVRYVVWKRLFVGACIDAGLRVADEMMQIARKPGNEHYLLEANAAYADLYFWRGRFADSARHAIDGLRLYDFDRDHAEHSARYGEDPAAVMLTYGALSLWLLGRDAEANELLERMQSYLETFTHSFSRGFLLFGLALHATARLDAAECARWAGAALELAKKEGMAQWLAVSTAFAGWSLAASGNGSEGMAVLEKGARLLLRMNTRVLGVLHHALIADAALRMGDLAKGLAAADSGLALAASCDDRFFLSEIHRLRASLLAAAGAADEEVQRAIEESLAISEAQGAVALTARARAAAYTVTPTGTGG